MTVKRSIIKKDEKSVPDTVETTTTQYSTSQSVQKKPLKLDENMLVNVASRTKGGLIYVSPRTRIPYRFDDYGYENVMELNELRSMLSSQRKFFERGWIQVLDQEVIDYLRLERFQKKVVDDSDIEYLFNDSTPTEIKELLDAADTNVKRLVFGFAREKYINGDLNNIHTIKAIEESLKQKLDPNN